MAKVTTVPTKPCQTENCDKTLPKDSPHDHCANCRAVDRYWKGKEPHDVIRRIAFLHKSSDRMSRINIRLNKPVREIIRRTPATKTRVATTRTASRPHHLHS